MTDDEKDATLNLALQGTSDDFNWMDEGEAAS